MATCHQNAQIFTICGRERGRIDEEKAEEYATFLGHPLTQKELRLIPYLNDCALNHKPIDQRKIDDEEREIIERWRNNNWFATSPYIMFTSEFWEFCCDVLYNFYLTTIILQDEDELTKE